MKSDPLFSVIIPVKILNDRLVSEIIPKIVNQTFPRFEIIILPDQKTTQRLPKTKIVPTFPEVGPAQKRDIGAQISKGRVLAFLDDDAYPSKNWLKNAVKYFPNSPFSNESLPNKNVGDVKSKKNNQVAAVCGPGITPPSDSLRQKASGWIWSTWLGAGGAGIYRCVPQKEREVDDFPTFNLLIRKEDFMRVGGFDSHFWPGEDTKICLDLVQKLGKKIIYDPGILVYHHRRSLFSAHLKQIGNYGLHRGHFARVLPQTSARLGYLIPVVFTLGILAGLPLLLYILILRPIYLAAVVIYLLLLAKEGIYVFSKERNLKLSMLVVSGIFLTHFWYGLRFIQGYFSKNLKQ